MSGGHGRSLFSGKQTAVLKTNVTDEFADAFGQHARGLGYATAADCLRDLAYVAVLGVDAMTNAHRARLESLVRRGTESGPAKSTDGCAIAQTEWK